AGGRAAFWTSGDGRTWTRASDEPSFGAPAGSGQAVSVVGIAANGGSIVAVGMQQSGGGDSPSTVLAWRSTDGATWTPASVDTAEGGQVFGVSTTAMGFLATGPSGDTSCLGGILSSTERDAWTRIASHPWFPGFRPYPAPR